MEHGDGGGDRGADVLFLSTQGEARKMPIKTMLPTKVLTKVQLEVPMKVPKVVVQVVEVPMEVKKVQMEVPMVEMVEMVVEKMAEEDQVMRPTLGNNNFEGPEIW